MLLFNKKETLYQRKQFAENMKVHGIPATIQKIHTSHETAYDFYNDVDEEDSFEDEIQTNLTYEEVPSIKTLKSLGWYIENESFPVIAYIPVTYWRAKEKDDLTYYPEVDDKVIIQANPIDMRNNSERQFLIKDFKGNGFPNTIYYTCKMVPLWEES